MQKTNSVYILTAEAKDLYNANHLTKDNPLGYNIRTKDGTINVKKYINALDYSLDLIKLREIYEKIYRRHDFSFKVNHKEYTRHVINVKFSYAQKEFNKAGSNIYIRNGYLYKDVKLENHICIIDNKLIAIETDVDVEEPYTDLSVLEDYFVYEDGQYKHTNNDIILNKADLRKELYSLNTFDKMIIKGRGDCVAISTANRRKYVQKFEDTRSLDLYLESLQESVTKIQNDFAPIVEMKESELSDF